ncbi:tRNA-uridine aminocarboxypropyltransferase [Desulfosporosinus sp. Sb-LF]|uniref:tRNA-uridine aminocarboxypropyltransferase n=1 Tax=Desulfosporosinus sp. Sb-LF TaxID=2560027 RepID=UPI00107F3067|nr:tRNA-uridine aminocarboxypropyltransferase [Desulfosporosinus sp. Sb-LF]TGE32112.1 DTW domain-containing protein [Desulfosporosinus sp. Sb-LF]
MNRPIKVKQITRLYESCNRCGLPTLTCICNIVSPINTKAKFLILSSEREFYRASSTGRLLKLINPGSTEIFLWERTNPSPGLMANIQKYRGKAYLLFPAESTDMVARSVGEVEEGPVAFVLIDGTWKEARKIVRKSDYLKDLPLVSLKPDYESRFSLRRGRVEGTICTIEAAMEILKLTGEIAQERIIGEYFDLFLKHYKAGTSSHLPKID